MAETARNSLKKGNVHLEMTCKELICDEKALHVSDLNFFGLIEHQKRYLNYFLADT